MPGYVLVKCAKTGAVLFQSAICMEEPAGDLRLEARAAGVVHFCNICSSFHQSGRLLFDWMPVGEVRTIASEEGR